MSMIKVLQRPKNGSNLWKEVLHMKRTRNLLSALLAFLLVFCSLSAGMTVLAVADEDAPIASAEPFASLKVGGKAIKLDNNDTYTFLNYGKTSAKVQWKLNEGWNVTRTSYFTSSNSKDTTLKNGGTVKVPKNGNAILDIHVDNGYSYKYCSIFIYNVKPRLISDTIWMGSRENMLSFDGFSGNAQAVSIKSSKPGVLAVTKSQGQDSRVYDCCLTPKKPGTSKITLVAKINGKKKTFSANYTVKPYPKPITMLKVDGKAVNLGKNKFAANVKTKKNKVKVQYKIAKGWKLKRCSYWDDAARKSVVVKSGGTVKTKDTAWVVFRLTRGKDVFWYDMQISH